MNKKADTSYEAIRSAALTVYYHFCRERGHGLRWSQEQIMGSVAYEFENAYENEVERMMLNVALLVLSAGMHPSVEEKLRGQIQNELKRIGLEKIQSEDAEFKNDLRVLRLI